jgi:hypothetical protein
MDQELIAYLDARFRETTQQISGLREETTQQISGLREETTQQITSLRDEFLSFRGESTKQITSLRGEFLSFRGESTQQITSLRDEFVSFREETSQNFDRADEKIRHVHVVVEGLRHEVHVLAEGLSGFGEQLSAFRTEVAHEFDDVRSLVSSSHKNLDRRLRPLEIRKA